MTEESATPTQPIRNYHKSMPKFDIQEWGKYIHDYGRQVIQCSAGAYLAAGKASNGISWVFSYPSESSGLSSLPFANVGKSMLRASMTFDPKCALIHPSFPMNIGDTFYIYWVDGICGKIRITAKGTPFQWGEFLSFIDCVKPQIDVLAETIKLS
jgi:hypothetical protein